MDNQIQNGFGPSAVILTSRSLMCDSRTLASFKLGFQITPSRAGKCVADKSEPRGAYLKIAGIGSGRLTFAQKTHPQNLYPETIIVMDYTLRSTTAGQPVSHSGPRLVVVVLGTGVR